MLIMINSDTLLQRTTSDMIRVYASMFSCHRDRKRNQLKFAGRK